jgi:hypothetical protein
MKAKNSTTDKDQKDTWMRKSLLLEVST